MLLKSLVAADSPPPLVLRYRSPIAYVPDSDVYRTYAGMVQSG